MPRRREIVDVRSPDVSLKAVASVSRCIAKISWRVAAAPHVATALVTGLLLAFGLSHPVVAGSPPGSGLRIEPPAASAAMTAMPPQTVEITLPFDGVWGVTQGFDSGKTHTGYAAYAIDFVPAQRVNLRGPRPPKPKRLGEFPCWGRPVLAPADGRVVWAHDGGPDHRPWSEIVHDAGNFIIIEHGPAQYTELRHLKSGSVRVSVGEGIRRGQPIARCGNSGTSSTPHLHLGLLGSADPIATRPMRISNYEVQGAEGDWKPGDGTPRSGDLLRTVSPP